MATLAQAQQEMINRGYSAYQVEQASAAYGTGGAGAMKSTIASFKVPTAPKKTPTQPYLSSTGKQLGVVPTSTNLPVVSPGSSVPTRTPATGAVTTQGAFNPYTGGYETVAGNVGVNQGQFSPEAKQNLWQQSGQTGAMNMDAFYRKTDGTLGIKPEFVKSTNPSALTDVDSMNAYLNGVQNNNFVGNGGSPTVTDYVAMAKELSGAMTTQAPQNFSREQTLSDLRGQYGVVDLESQLTELDKQANDLEAQRRQRVATEQNKPVAMGVIGGRVSEIERQEAERIDAVNRSRSYVSSQLAVKNSLIEGVMKAKSEDYATSASRYDAEFSKNLQMINLARGISQDQQTAQDKQSDNARATVQTIYNTVTSGGLNPSTMTDSQKANIARLELQAGFPAGFIQNLYDKNPKGDIIYTGKETAADGNDYVTIIMKDKVTGETNTQKVLIGKSAAQANKEAELKIKQQNANTAAAKKKTVSSGGTKKTTDPSKDIQFYQQQVAKGAVSVEAAISSIKAKYPESAGKDLTPLFK